jgi:hypothetical protein
LRQNRSRPHDNRSERETARAKSIASLSRYGDAEQDEECRQAADALDEVLAMLKSVEKAAFEVSPGCCPICNNYVPVEIHAPDCRLAAAITRPVCR